MLEKAGFNQPQVERPSERQKEIFRAAIEQLPPYACEWSGGIFEGVVEAEAALIDPGPFTQSPLRLSRNMHYRKD